MNPVVKRAIDNGLAVAFICAGNTCRSPMLAALFKQRFAKDPGVTVLSAGWRKVASESQPAAPEWGMLETETSINLGRHKSRNLNDLNLSQIGAFVALEEEAAAALRAAGVQDDKIIVIAVSNPFLDEGPGRLDAYRACFADAERVVADLLAA